MAIILSTIYQVLGLRDTQRKEIFVSMQHNANILMFVGRYDVVTCVVIVIGNIVILLYSLLNYTYCHCLVVYRCSVIQSYCNIYYNKSIRMDIVTVVINAIVLSME